VEIALVHTHTHLEPAVACKVGQGVSERLHGRVLLLGLMLREVRGEGGRVREPAGAVREARGCGAQWVPRGVHCGPSASSAGRTRAAVRGVQVKRAGA